VHPDVAWVVPNTVEPLHGGAMNPPDDPLFATTGRQWWLYPAGGSDANAIDQRLRGVPGFQSAWRHAEGSAVVAVLDTGVTSHVELEGRVLPGYDFVSDWDGTSASGYAADGDGRDSDPSDPGDTVTEDDRRRDPGRYTDCRVQPSSWHGTTIAGMLVAHTGNRLGVAAMQWQGNVVPVRVAGRCGAEVADIVDAMRWAAGLPVPGVPDNAHPARVISISFGGAAPCNEAYRQAIADIAEAPGGGAVLVASAGNRAGAPTRPANCEGVVGVTAVNRDGFKASYANFGAGLSLATVGGDDTQGRWGGLVADDGLLVITDLGVAAPSGSGYRRVFGTSFAAPLVSGTLALMLSANPTLSAEQLRAGLERGARPHVVSPYLDSCTQANPGRCACTRDTCGAGLLDAEQAVLYALDPQAYVAPARAPEAIRSVELERAAALGPDRSVEGGAKPEATAVAAGALDAPTLLVLAGVVLTARRRRSASRRARGKGLTQDAAAAVAKRLPD
jgi:serine protease